MSFIGIHMMLVDSLHINRWLCGDNVHRVAVMMMLLHVQTHRYPVMCTHLKNKP